ncbi:MAG TPA: hypothetical protein VHP33_37015 [Polyangiaceae bacterium]|nr:hypothetical protein [Polyangiaceae bacterium]
MSEQNEAAVTAGSASQSRGGTPSGGGPTLSTGGKSSFGGTFVPGGMASAGFPTAGVATMGGAPNPDCSLSVGDCRLPSEVRCADTHSVCAGELAQQAEFDASFVVVNDLAVSTSGRLALAGRFRGSLDFGGDSQPLVSAETGTTGTDAFVVSIDASGAAQWSYAYSRNASDDITGVGFAPNGDLVLQGQDATGVFVERLDAKGNVLWSNWSASTLIETGRVGVDNDGRILLGGNYSGSLNLAGAQSTRETRSGYLIKLERDGDLIWAADTIPAEWTSASAADLAVDDEDNIVVVGAGVRNDSTPGAFMQKITSNADAFVATLLPAELSLRSVAVDRNMRVVAAGTFQGKLSYGGQIHELSAGSAADVWVAQYTRQGDLVWQKTFASGTNGASVDSVAVDPFGNVVVVGNGLQLDTSLPKPRREQLYALRLRPDGSYVWSQSFDPFSQHSALGIDNRSNIWLAGSANVDPPGMYAFLFQIFP